MIKLEVIGIYKITPTLESILKAARFHKYDWLIDENGRYTDEINWIDFENLGLIEIQIMNSPPPQELLSTISQNDQAPYLEFYLDSTGTQNLSEDEVLASSDWRLCFFIHFVDVKKPLAIGTEQLKLESMSKLPKRLEPFTQYVPVD